MTTDERLLIGLSNQEQQSLVDLYDRYCMILWEISYRTVADNAICEEILRLVFQDVWTRPSDFNNGKKLSTLLIECCQSKLNLLTLQKYS
ncbi:MAG TPA: hypothetical protein VI423_11275 [Paenisporosarcina sp.]|nr:hypothetical protein [Paenisporosarcina sp.]